MTELHDKASVRRSLLYLSPAGAQGTLSALNKVNGWAVDHVLTIQQAKGKLGTGHYSIALVHLEFLQREQPGSDQLLQSDNPLIWIVLVDAKHSSCDFTQQLKSRPDIFLLAISDLKQPRQLASVLTELAQRVLLQPCHQLDCELMSHSQIIGSSAAMRHLLSAIDRLAMVDMPLLLAGEPGTGKGLIASNIHKGSERSSHPYIAVNCRAAGDRQLAISLFGDEHQTGAIERADGGSIFLNDVSCLPKHLQRRLMRYLLEGVIEMQHAQETRQVRTRIIAATSVDLYEEVSAGRFREDLFYQLSALNLFVPPLRMRGKDIELLSRYLFEKLRRDFNKGPSEIDEEAMVALNAHHWPGNVTELVNRLRRALVMCDGDSIGVVDIGLHDASGPCTVKTLEQAREDAEAAVIRGAMTRNKRNVSRTARELGVSRVTLYRLLNKYDLLPETNS